MQAGTALLDVSRDGGIRSGCFQQLERRAAHRYEMRAHALRLDCLGRVDLEAKRVAVERERRLQVLDGNADVIENGFHLDARFSRSEAAEYGSSSRAEMRSTIRCSSPGASTSRSRRSMKRCATSSRNLYSLRVRLLIVCAFVE